MPKRIALLLPPNRTPLESALVETLYTQEHPARTITTLYDAAGIDAQLLPWLAWSRDVLAWPRNASETTRRNLAAGSWRQHRQMGTLAGMREAAAVFGGTITKAIVPPAKSYAGQSLTTAERNAFIERYPQLRLYPQRLTGKRVGAMLWRAFTGAALYPVQTDAALRLAPQAFLYRDGVETPLQSIERTQQTDSRTAQDYTEVRRPGAAGYQAFAGRQARWLVRSDAASRIYRITLETPYLDGRELLRRVAVQASLSPLTVRYDWVAGRGTALGVFTGQCLAGHMRRSLARERIYKRTWLFDPLIDAGRRGAMSFCGTSLLSMPAHHAQLSISMPGRMHAQVASRYLRGFMAASNQSGYRNTLDALRAVARVSDRIAINTAVTRPLTAAGGVLAGTATAGEWRAS